MKIHQPYSHPKRTSNKSGWVFTHPRIAPYNSKRNQPHPFPRTAVFGQQLSINSAQKCNLPVVLLKKYGAFPPELTRVPAVESTKSSFGLIYSLYSLIIGKICHIQIGNNRIFYPLPTSFITKTYRLP